MDAAICPVKEVDRVVHEAPDQTDAQGRDADARVLGPREAQTRIAAASVDGVVLQLIELELAIDEKDEAKATRLAGSIRQAVDALIRD